jgi:ABC-type uncharacterized transport system substrate-binding protein
MARLAVALMALVLLSAPLTAEAQPTAKVARIGYLSVAGGAGSPLAEAFRRGLRELGYIEGQNIAIEFRAAEGSDRLRALAAELVQLHMDVIVAFSSVAAQAAKNTTTTVPIVMVSSGNPVDTGLVASLARPGGNITGLSALATDLSGKRLELLKETVPNLSRVAVLWNSLDGGMTLTFRGIEAASRALGVRIQPLGVREPKDIDSAIAAMTEERPDALFMITDVLTRSHTGKVVGFAAKHQAPDDVRRQRTRGRGGTDELWTECHGSASTRGLLCGSHSERRQACRPPRRAAHQVRARRQPQDREGPRSDNPAVGARAHRRGHQAVSMLPNRKVAPASIFHQTGDATTLARRIVLSLRENSLRSESLTPEETR